MCMDLIQVKKNLEQRRFHVTVFETAKEASAYLNEQIDDTTVGIGGSVTVKEMGLFDTLSEHNTVWWHNAPQQVADYGRMEVLRKAADTQVYISSVNAMTQSGQMINIDNTGNRIASTVYGHEKVYLVIGVNKIEETFERAMWRARNIASPKNAQRMGLKTPCAAAGDRCYDCNSPQRICNTIQIMEAPTKGQETEIILINEKLGY